MQSVHLCKGESNFQFKLISQGLRLDGREVDECRQSSVELQILPLSPSSCKVFWGLGYNNRTEIIVSVSTEIYKTNEAQPSFTVKCLPNSFGDTVDSNQICNVIQTTLFGFLSNSGIIDPDQFVIKNSPYSWKLFIDVLIFKAAGGVYEASLLGIREAFRNLTFPDLIITPGETVGELLFDIDESKPPKKILKEENLPYAFSYATSGSIILSDPTPLEVSVLGSLIVIGVDKNGNLIGLDHFGKTDISNSTLDSISQKASLSVKTITS